MTLKLGAYTACLHDRPLEAALDVLESNGLTSVEVNTGGFIPSPHCHIDLLLSSAQARRDYLDVFASRGMELTGLNCNGNPLNPLPGAPSPRSIRTWRSTSSTRTPATPAWTAWPSPPGTSAPLRPRCDGPGCPRSVTLV